VFNLTASTPVLPWGNGELFMIDGIIIIHVNKVLGLNLYW